MKSAESITARFRAGFTLPAVLVIASALLLLAIGLLLVVGIERKTARSYLDRERAELTARAGLEDVVAVLRTETANDDFVIVQSTLATPITTGKTPAPGLFIARGTATSTNPTFRYLPLFSNTTAPTETKFTTPEMEPLVSTADGASTEISTLPYLDKSRLAWIPVTNMKGQLVGRYAFWVEDLQSRLDARTAGNTKDLAGAHKRFGWVAGDTSPYAKFPAPGLNPAPPIISTEDGRDMEPPLDPVGLYALDPDVTTAQDTSVLDKTIIDNRVALVSPDSVLAVAGIRPPLTRDATGRLVDLKARAVEENLTASVQPYDEQALVPFAKGLAPTVVGKPKMNLNRLLSKPADAAVEEMADWINSGLPNFEDRKGGFPDDYLKTLAAGAIDYADTDNEGSVRPLTYRGLDGYPMMSEIIMSIRYLGNRVISGRRILVWRMSGFVELYNHTNIRAAGSASFSYENGLELPAIGAAPVGRRFDDPALLNNPTQVTSTPPLTQSGGRYWSAPLNVTLNPGEYRFYRFVDVDYLIDVGSSSTVLQNTFSLTERLGAAGMSMRWNNLEVDRADKIVRNGLGLEFTSNFSKTTDKAAIPGHSYGPFGDFVNNMGDPRMTLYYRENLHPLGENAAPENLSPNRRNIRQATIYNSDSATKPKTYGRVLPSEWPDGGHDSAVGSWFMGNTDGTDPTLATYAYPVAAKEGETPTFLSNRGRFYSVTELGRIYDPVMYVPTFDNPTDSGNIQNGLMPTTRSCWPSVEVNSAPSIIMGGGNTLRIGRPEHPRFDQPVNHLPSDMPDRHAARLLDLFTAGKSRSENKDEREGPLVRIEGHININTASVEALRSLAAGVLTMDPLLSRRTSETHQTSGLMAPPTQTVELSAATKTKEADRIAEAIVKGRPFASASELACAINPDERRSNEHYVFGNPFLYPTYTLSNTSSALQWSDAASEETFARVFEASTTRSRNFRVWVIGQALSPTEVTNTSPEVLAEVRKAFTVFSDPGERTADGAIDPTKFKVTVLNENDF